MSVNNIEAEQWVIGSLLLDFNRINSVVEIIPSGVMFSDYRHMHIYDAMLDVYDEQGQADPIVLAERLRNRPMVSMAYLVELLDSVPTASAVKTHARIVRDKFQLRDVIEKSKSLADEALRASTLDDISTEKVSELFRVLEKDSNKTVRSMGDVLDSVLAKSKQREEGKIKPVLTGYPKLDAVMGGMWPGDLTVLAARTSKGKSSLGINIADNITANDPNAVVLYFALELTAEDIGTRILAHRSAITATLIRDGMVGYQLEGWERLRGIKNDLNAKGLFISDSPGLSVQEIRATCRQVKIKQGRLDIVFIDHAGLMRGDGAKRHEQLESITRGLKGLAKEFNMPVFCIAQINRESVKKDGGQPELHEIKGSGSYEEDAQQVLLLSKSFSNDGVDPAVVRVEKNTHGACGKADMMFVSRFCRFEEVE